MYQGNRKISFGSNVVDLATLSQTEKLFLLKQQAASAPYMVEIPDTPTGNTRLLGPHRVTDADLTTGKIELSVPEGASVMFMIPFLNGILENGINVNYNTTTKKLEITSFEEAREGSQIVIII